MGNIRSFLAIELPDEVKGKLKNIQETLKSRGVKGIRWVDPGKIHLTLKFLGEISQAQIEKIIVSFQQPISMKPIQIQVEDLGVFPNPNRPRVVWVGIARSEELSFLQKQIEVTCSKLGIPSEDRAFSPHLTLGRVSNTASTSDIMTLKSVLLLMRPGIIGTFGAKGFILFRSNLTPQGPIYTPIKTFPLAENMLKSQL